MQTRSKSKSLTNGNKFQADISVNRDFNTGHANPLCIPEIADHMFQFLKLTDIKKCRLVCQQWNQLAEKFIKKLSVVNILKPERCKNFNQLFPNAERSKIFACFRFDGFKSPLCKFVSFCEKWYHNLSEITLFEADFGLDKENETYDLSPVLPSTLITLRIQKCNPLMTVSLDKICKIRVLELEKCILNIMPGIVLNLVEIDLEGVTIFEDKEKIDEFLINPLLNLDVLKKASFSGKNIMLDLQGSYSVDHLSLQKGVKLFNWETSNWEIKKFLLGVNTGSGAEEKLSKSQIKYKELQINLPHLNVSLLPEAIETLQVTLYNDRDAPPRISGEHNFPDLKHLFISVEEGNSFAPFFDIFTHCPKLSELTVSCFPLGGEIILKTSSVPPKVKNIQVICGVQIILDRSLQLDSLTLYHTHSNIVHIVQELHVKNLVWVEKNFMDGNIFDNEKGNIVKKLIDLNLDSFVVGEFPPVNNSEFEKSYLFPLVDKQGKDYLFISGRKGIAM